MNSFISWHHILVLFLAALLRLLLAYDTTRKSLKQENKIFIWSEYFSDKWDNWLIHIISMTLGIMTLPGQVDALGRYFPEYLSFLTEIKNNDSLNILATAVFGFAGYDAVSLLVSIVKLVVGGIKKKFGIKEE